VNRALHRALVHVKAALVASFRILPAAVLGKNPLPGPIARGGREFQVKGTGEGDAAEAVSLVSFVDRADVVQMLAEGRFEGGGKHRNAVLRALAVPDQNLGQVKVDILDSDRQAFRKAETGTVHQAGGETLVAFEEGENRTDLVAAHHDGKAGGFFRADNLAERLDALVSHVAEKKENGGKGLVLGRGAYLDVHGERGKEGVDVLFGQRERALALVIPEESGKPGDIGLAGSGAVVSRLDELKVFFAKGLAQGEERVVWRGQTGQGLDRRGCACGWLRLGEWLRTGQRLPLGVRLWLDVRLRLGVRLWLLLCLE